MSTLFWICTATVFYAYAGYPILIFVLSRFVRRRAAPAQSFPTVSLLIAAHNEQDVIEERIKNALATDYPVEKLQIVIASDGSTDETNEIVRRFEHVELLDHPHRRGKAATLNAAIPHLTGDLIVFSDANTNFESRAIQSLGRWFSDPTIATVVGRLVLTDPATGRNADGLYWRYETFIKKCEARLGALLGANGAIYAIRRSHYVPIPEQTIVDDFVAPLLIKLTTGCRIIYEPDAIAHEESAPDVASEFRRRARIGAGDLQALQILWPLLHPRHGWTAFAFFSHKILRWFTPFLLIATLISSIVYPVALYCQLAFYATSLLPLPRALRLAQMFTRMNLALLIGFVRFCTGGQSPTWRPTPRTAQILPTLAQIEKNA
jgi:cellulose synthase/poly-beta-1,6-N-acetylglucosamine synthase-like glycosyltransferase